MVPTNDHKITRHFFAHYARLGVNLRDHACILLHVIDDKSFRTMLAIMTEFQVSHYKNVTSYSSALKNKQVNKWLKTLPPDAWVMYADNDEFFQIDCHVMHRIDRGETTFWGTLADRLGPGMTVPELQGSPDIHAQYPVSCPGLRTLMGGTDRKYVLFKAHFKASSGERQVRQFRNSHHFTSEYDRKGVWHTVGHGPLPIPHFTFIGRAMLEKMRNKESYLKYMYDAYLALFDLKSGVPRMSDVGRKKIRSLCDHG